MNDSKPDEPVTRVIRSCKLREVTLLSESFWPGSYLKVGPAITDVAYEDDEDDEHGVEWTTR